MNDNNDISYEKTGSGSENIFASFKEQRESRGLSLLDIFAATRISVNNLGALEDGDFKSLPPPVYTRSFITQYTRTIGIDEKPLLDIYDSYLAQVSKPVKITEVQKPWPEENRRYWLLYGGLAIAIAAGLIVLASFLYNHKGKPLVTASLPVSEDIAPPVATKTEIPSSKPFQEPATLSLATKTEVPFAFSQTETTTDSAPGKIVQPLPEQGLKNIYRLIIEANELTWIRIETDEKEVSEILLRPGEKIERKASKSFLLDIGNAGGVSISFQGKALGALGKHGEVVHIRLPDQEQGGNTR